MPRPTIKTLADAAGVSVSTVNRIIGGSSAVREQTREHIIETARTIGFYGLGSLETARLADRHRIGVLLLQEERPFYREIAKTFLRLAGQYTAARIEMTVQHLNDLSPKSVARALLELGAKCDGIAVTSANNPVISDALDALRARGVPVVGIIAPLTARNPVGFIGLDNYRVGRSAAWFFHRMCRQGSKIGILVGSHRYLNQDQNESGFRAFFREHDPQAIIPEPVNTFESVDIAQEITEDLLKKHPDMIGLYISGGGIRGALNALRNARQNLPGDFVAIGYEMMGVTREALIDGTLTAVIAHPVEELARTTIDTLVKDITGEAATGGGQIFLNFEIYTPENI